MNVGLEFLSIKDRPKLTTLTRNPLQLQVLALTRIRLGNFRILTAWSGDVLIFYFQPFTTFVLLIYNE